MTDRLAEFEESDDEIRIQRAPRGRTVYRTTIFGISGGIGVAILAAAIILGIFAVAGIAAFSLSRIGNGGVTVTPTPTPTPTPVPTPPLDPVLLCSGFSDIAEEQQSEIVFDCNEEALGFCSSIGVCQPNPIFSNFQNSQTAGITPIECNSDQCGAGVGPCSCLQPAGALTCVRSVQTTPIGDKSFSCGEGLICDDFTDSPAALLTNCQLGQLVPGNCVSGSCNVDVVGLFSTRANPTIVTFSLEPANSTCEVAREGLPCTGRGLFCQRFNLDTPVFQCRDP